MGFLRPQRERLSTTALSELIPEEAKCRLVLRLVSELDLSALYDRYSAQGGHALDPKAMLATWFFAYSEGITSTRALETACRRDLHFIFISGNLQPDHTSLSRFRKRNLDLMPALFVQLVQKARARDLSDFSSVAIDGTKIQAAASAKKSKDAEALGRYLRAVRHRIDEYMQRCQSEDEDDSEGPDRSMDRSRSADHPEPSDTADSAEVSAELDRLQTREARILECGRQLEARKEALKAEHRTHHQINLTDPEACYQAGSCRVGYNAQVAVCTQTQFILNCDVVTDRNDQQQFTNQYEQLEENLGHDPERESVLDSGYHSLEVLEALEKQQIDALIAEPNPQHRSRAPEQDLPSAESLQKRGRALERSDFLYDAEQDVYLCSGGDRLRRVGSRRQKGRLQQIYEASQCAKCPLQRLCFSNKRGLKRIYRDAKEHLAERMYRRLQQPVSAARMKLRRETVEPVIGNLKANLGYNRFRLHGLEQVRGEFALMCIGHNLCKLFSLLSELLYALFGGAVGPTEAALHDFKERGEVLSFALA